MVSLITISKAQEKIAEYTRKRRLAKGLTQVGLADRSGVSVSSLRKFERKGIISLESFLKLCMALGCLEDIVKSLEPSTKEFSSIDEVINTKETKKPQRGWRK